MNNRSRKINLRHAKMIATHSPEEFWEMVVYYNMRCLRCGSKFQEGGGARLLTKDHIIPISDGGSDCITNLQPLCSECNNSCKTHSDYRLTHPKEFPRKWCPYSRGGEIMRERQKLMTKSARQAEQKLKEIAFLPREDLLKEAIGMVAGLRILSFKFATARSEANFYKKILKSLGYDRPALNKETGQVIELAARKP